MQLVLTIVLCLSAHTATLGYSYQHHGPSNPWESCLHSVMNGSTATKRAALLPGRGWDNLVNEERAMVYHHDYTACRHTANYLLPDHVRLYLRKNKNNKRRVLADIFDRSTNFTSALAKTINQDNFLDKVSSRINGKFSSEFRTLRKLIDKDAKAMTTRVQIRDTSFKTSMVPDAPLAPAFVNTLRQIALLLHVKRKDAARYVAQRMVRDYGTHVTTSLDAGTNIVEADNVPWKNGEQLRNSRKAILDSAIQRLKDWLRKKMKPSVDAMARFNEETVQAAHKPPVWYSKTFSSQSSRFKRESMMTTGNLGAMMTASTVISYGGAYSRSEPSPGDDADLVAIDRNGVALYDVITQSSLPDVEPSILIQVHQLVKQSVITYYKYNIHRGCTDPDAPNFSPIANVDDSSCEIPTTHFSLGGLYQQCYTNGSDDICNGKSVVNPMTGDLSCPESYIATVLDKQELVDYRDVTTCRTCWAVFECCDTKPQSVHATLTAYWCAKESNDEETDGYLFGGIYSPYAPNLLTGNMSCPEHFFMAELLDGDLIVCLSDGHTTDNDLDDCDYCGDWSDQSVAFGGFYSCVSGNPLASSDTEIPDTEFSMSCPDGYSQQLALSRDNCDVYYCLQSGELHTQTLQELTPPPFMKKPLFPWRFIDNATVTVKEGLMVLSLIDRRSKNMMHGPNLEVTDHQLKSSELDAATMDAPNMAASGHLQATRKKSTSNFWAVLLFTLLCALVCVAIGGMCAYRKRSEKHEKYTRV